MRRARWIVAAALGGGALTTLTVAALALGSGQSRHALVTLQVAPRGPGSVTAAPIGPGDAHPCTKQDGADDCRWTYERGTTVRLTATADGAGRAFSSWSDAECGTRNPCSVQLDDDITSVVAVFSPLMLGVRFSGGSGGATVTASPPGQPCVEPPSNSRFCGAYPPHTRVTLTLTPGTNPFRGWNDQGDYRCEPTDSTTCTIAVDDQPTWAGARFEGNSAPGLPPTISVELKVRKSGSGSGRVTAPKLDCGTVCTASLGYGKPVALTASPDEGSLFDGWSGVCARTRPTCTFPAGPITSIRAVFNRDAIAPTAPGPLVVGNRTRTSLAISWSASTDNVRVSGYRVYVDEAMAGETQATGYTVQGLKCGRRYVVAVDAVDTLGNRSQRASITAETRPCVLAARLAGVGVSRVGGTRIVVVFLRANRATTARLRLLRAARSVANGRYAVKPGTTRLRLRVPPSVAGGEYRLATTLVDPGGGILVLPRRGVFLPRP